MTMREKIARAIDDACIAYSKSHAGLNLRKWDTPGEVMSDAALRAFAEPDDEMVGMIAMACLRKGEILTNQEIRAVCQAIASMGNK